jgi:multidrug resistance efflux pump
MKALLNSLRRFALTGLMAGMALWAGYKLWDYYFEEPWTRDGHVRADVVPVAPDVSGFVTEVLVGDNQQVQRGDVLFRIDRARYDIALRQAEAVRLGKRAMLDEANADLDRYSALTPGVVVSKQRMDQVVATQGSAQAAYDQAVADVGLAKLNLERSEVRASVNGVVTNMELRPGTYLTPGKGVMALLDTDTLHVQGYFEETKLPRIHVGDPVKVRLMGSDQMLRGRVESVAAGIEDRDRSAGATLLANVNPTFNWVRLAQRVPVRIALDQPAERSELVAGATATVEVVGSVLRSGERPRTCTCRLARNSAGEKFGVENLEAERKPSRLSVVACSAWLTELWKKLARVA